MMDRDSYVSSALNTLIVLCNNTRIFNLGKLFKTPIFERWGKQFCLN